jgi:uncharacterized protein YecE (DUF72 family)
MVDYYIGTMGFSYTDWAGSFYPPGVRSSDFLVHYARIFNSVEIDSTFYGIPKSASVMRWDEQSPDDFKICLKVPRLITHEAGLDNVDREMARFLDSVAPLGQKLAVILIQFPPSFDISRGKLLVQFLKNLPGDQEFAVEFRHPSWYIPRTAEVLTENSVCWTATEYPGLPREVPLTSDILFIRLVGQHGRFSAHDREQINVTMQLQVWWKWMRSSSERVKSAYVFVNDDYSGHAPASANRLKEMMGLPVVKPDIPKQMRLL